MTTMLRVDFNRFPAIAAGLKPAASVQIRNALNEARAWIAQDMASKSPPSAPGETPAIVSGELVGSLSVDNVSDLHGELNAGGSALFMEFGTVHISPRPFLQPASVRIADQIPKGLKTAIEALAG